MKQLPIVPYPKKVTFKHGKGTLSEKTKVKYKKDKDIPEEGYTLSFGKKGITITSSTATGKFYAEQTLAQLRTADKLPYFEIKDEPKYGYRGFSLDCARHFFSVDDVKKVIDSAALLKFNHFHWHLTDDQGWRIESKKYPKLTEIGSVRPCSTFGRERDYTEYGGFYTQDEIRDIVKYCADRQITVVPEVDMPGHTSALLSAYPEYSCTGEPVAIETDQGIKENILCVGDETTLSFAKDLLDELCELFPGKYFHIGGDETIFEHWRSCPKCSGKRKELGLRNYYELQGWFTSQLADHLETKGKRAIVWNDALKGKNLTPDEVIVQRWLGDKTPVIDFVNNGGKLIESDFYHYYCDYPYGMTPTRKTYNYNPAFKGLSKKGKQNVLGVECELWTEYVLDFDRICCQYYPRMMAVSEAGWNPGKYKEFKERLNNILPLFEEYGISVIPEKEWDPGPFSTIRQLVVFYSGITNEKTKKTLKQLKENEKV